MNIINFFLLLNKLHSEFNNQEKTICYIFNCLEQLFKKNNVKRPYIAGGFSRTILCRGSWDKIESHFELKNKDIDIVLTKSDYYTFLNNLKETENLKILYKGNETSRIEIFPFGINYSLKIDIFYPVGSLDIISSNILIDVYKRKFINIYEIYKILVLKRDGLCFKENKTKDRSVDMVRLLWACREMNFPLNKHAIKQLKTYDKIMSFQDLSFLRQNFKNMYKYLKDDTFFKKCICVCDILELKNYKKSIEYIKEHIKVEDKKEYEFDTNCDKLVLNFSSKRMVDFDIVNICKNKNFDTSIFFYLTLRTDGINLILEIGYHDGKDWEKKNIKINNNEEIVLTITNHYLKVNCSGMEIITDFINKDKIWVLNYDYKQRNLT